jgi:uncharacterized protein
MAAEPHSRPTPLRQLHPDNIDIDIITRLQIYTIHEQPMTDILSKPCTAFNGNAILSSGPLIEVALAVKTATERDPTQTVLVFEDETGRAIDFDLRGSKADIIARLTRQPKHTPSAREMPSEARGRGRPKLGVVAREVTLLPRHWDWLAAQPGGASVTLRKLVEDARRGGGDKEKRRAAQDAAYRFMSAMAGNLPCYEEAIRALYANDRPRFEQCIAGWPADVRDHAARLAATDLL